MNPFLAALDPLAVRQGARLLGGVEPPAAPTGAPHGSIGAVAGARQLVVVGDEFAGGWGLGSSEEQLAASLARSLAERDAAGVVWQSVVEPGCTIRQVHQQLLERLPSSLDRCVLWLGWADVVARTPCAEWRSDMAATLRILVRRGRVTVVGCPPVDAMPRLRPPLSWLLAARAAALDEATEAACREVDASFVALQQTGAMASSASDFQDDGVHLSGAGQASVAGAVARTLAA